MTDRQDREVAAAYANSGVDVEPANWHSLEAFLSLSPRPYVRAARADASQGYLNSYPDKVQVSDVDPARPVAVHLGYRGLFRLLVFDLDRGSRSQLEIHAQGGRLLVEARACGIAAVVAESGPRGGLHLWMACPEGVPPEVARRLAHAAREVAPAVDVAPLTNVTTGCVRPPGAAHRIGGYSRLLTPRHADEAVSTLREGTPREAFVRLAERLEACTLATAVQAQAGPAPKRLGQLTGSRDNGPKSSLPPSVTGGRSGGTETEPVRRIANEEGFPRLSRGRRALSEHVQGLLESELGADEDHSDRAFSVLLGMAAAGWSATDAQMLCAAARSSPGLEWLRSRRAGATLRVVRGEAERARVFAEQWRHAVERAARLPLDDLRDIDPRSDVTVAVATLMERMRAAGPGRWARPSGPADWLTLHAVALTMLTAGALEVGLDVRRCAAMTGYSHETANCALRRLMADGWLAEISPADPEARRARVVSLATKHVCTADPRHVCAVSISEGSDTSTNAPPGGPPSHPPAPWLSAVLHAAASPLWALKGVGHHVLRTYLALADGPVTLVELCTETGYERRTVRKHLLLLREFGVVRRQGERRWGRSRRSLAAAVAVIPQAVAVEQERLLRTQVDEAVFAWWCAEMAWLRLGWQARRARRRKPPEQGLLAVSEGLLAGARAYPRRGGRPDHAAARRIELARLKEASPRREHKGGQRRVAA